MRQLTYFILALAAIQLIVMTIRKKPLRDRFLILGIGLILLSTVSHPLVGVVGLALSAASVFYHRRLPA